MARILGIDPGSRVTGYGVLDIASDRPSFVAASVIRTGDGEMTGRLEVIFDQVRALIAEYAPDVMAIENVFVSRNAASALKLGAARSAAICASFGSGIGVAEYSPREIKQAVTGTGGADKAQMRKMMRMLMRLDHELSADAADGLAVALCHANAARMNALLGQRRFGGA